MEPARKFKIIVNSKECGTCSGPTPSAVAKKVVKKLCGTSSKVVKFSLKECKRGCERECGPYQGRMEKLDKPYTRTGKKITHRVVCGKVRKMRGGALSVSNFRKSDERNFKNDTDFFKPVIFFGEIEGKEREEEEKEETYYEFAIFNKKHRGGPVGISQLVKNDENDDNNILVVKTDIEKIFDTPAAAPARNNNTAAPAPARNNNAPAQNNNTAAKNKLKENLKELYKFLKNDKTKYKRIQEYICSILDIDENNNIPAIFKRNIPETCPYGFDYIPYVAYKDQIEGFNETKFYEFLSQKEIKMFRSEGKKILELIIPKIVTDSSKRVYNLKNKVFAYRMVRHENRNKIIKNYSVYLSVSKDNYFTVLFKYNDVIYIGIVYNNNQKNVVIFYPILENYNSNPELDLIYSVCYYFFIIIHNDLINYFYLSSKDRYVLTKFYYNYISSFLDKKTYNIIVEAILSTWTDKNIPIIKTENEEPNIWHILNILKKSHEKQVEMNERRRQRQQ